MSAPKVTPLVVGASGYIAGVCRQLRIAELVNRLVTWDDTQWKRSPGTLIVALIINILTGRRPLYRVWESFERLDLPTLFDEPVQLADLNDDAFGRALDRLHASGNAKLLVHSVALRAVHLLPLGIRSVHADTTSIALCGAYEWTESDEQFAEAHPDRSLLRITYGYSKDNRPDLKQFIYGLIVSAEGLPLIGEVRDGNLSDKVWHRDTLDEIRQSFLDPQKVVYVADSALVTPENLARIDQYRMRFISRLPESYRLAAELKDRAWALNAWETVGRVAQSEKAASYRAQSFVEPFEGRPYRFIVVHSSALDSRKKKALERRIAKERAELAKAVQALAKQRFNCQEDATKALDAFLRTHADAVHQVTGTVREERLTKRRPGRPRKDEVPQTTVQWRLELQIAAPTEEALQQLHERESTFVLITNLMDPEWSNADVLREYKDQTAVETRFRNLKATPCIVDGIYVKSSRRAEALAYVFLLALIVAAYIEIRIRQELKRRKRQFVMPGKRLTDRPTMTGIFDIMRTVLIVIVETAEGTYRMLPTNTDPRVHEILELSGLDESVYTRVTA